MANPLVDELKKFLAEHPELVPSVISAANEALAGPPTPLTLEGILHDLIDGYAHRAPVDGERVAQMHDVVAEHFGQAPAAASSSEASSPAEPSSAPVDPSSFDPPGA